MTRRGKLRLAAAAAAAVTLLLGAAAIGASIASASGPPVTAPSSGPGPYYSGPVHVCLSAGNESAGYSELHSTGLGNCAAGYRQAAINELTPAFTLQLGALTYACTADTAQARTAIACALSSPSSAPSPTSTASASPAASSSSGG